MTDLEKKSYAVDGYVVESELRRSIPGGLYVRLTCEDFDGHLDTAVSSRNYHDGEFMPSIAKSWIAFCREYVEDS